MMGIRGRIMFAGLILSGALLAPWVSAEEVVVKDVRVPNFVYSAEKNNICISVSNNGGDDKTVTVIVHSRPRHGKDRQTKRSFTARAGREDSILVAFDMAWFPKRAGILEVTLEIDNKKVSSRRIEIRDSFAGLEGIETRLGRLYTADGTPCIICTVLEDPARYRKWAPIKWLRKLFDTSPKRVVVLGSLMSNKLDGSSGSYVWMLQRLVEKDEESFVFAPRTEGLRPILGDMLKAGGLTSEHKAEIFVFCPGVEDIYAGVPIREFKRALDVMIDQVRLSDPPPRIVLVTPVPLLSDMKLSERFRQAVRDAASEHHTDIVDTRRVLERFESSLRKSYRDGDSDTYYLYPVEKGQKLIARAIKRYVY